MNKIMQKPKFITFTGFDDRTDIKGMQDIAINFPVEWGVLISPTNRDARFPSKQAIQELEGKHMDLSLHCCGAFSKAMQTGSKRISEFPINYIPSFQRLQLNGKIQVPKHKLIELHKTIHKDFIIQTRDKFSNDGIFQLFDTSGGRGIAPEQFPEHPGYMVGYAGGISPYNILKVIKKINAPEGAEYWIDMESGVRTNDWFDLRKVYTVCSKVYGD